MMQKRAFFLLIFGAAALAEGSVPPPQPSAVPTPEPVTTPTAPGGVDSANLEMDEVLRLRDPFQRPASAMLVATRPSSDLESFAVEQFRLVGVITGMQRLRAILQDPSGKTHFVSEKMRIGTRRGIIRQIRDDAVIVREKVTNVLGREELIDSEIRLPDESSLKSRSGASTPPSG